MSVTIVVLWLMAPRLEHKDIPLQEAPQVVCPLSLDEYASIFRWWARKEVKERQLERGDLLRGKI